MPLFFGFIGFSFPAGLVLYWTVSNLFMIGQQTLLLRAGHIGPDALEKRMAEQKAKLAAQADKPAKKGFMASMMERADAGAEERAGARGRSPLPPEAARPRNRRSHPARGRHNRRSPNGPDREATMAPEPTTPRRLDELEEQADAAADFLDELLARMDIDAIAEPNPHEGHMYVDIVDGPDEDMSLLIGRHGQTLEAIQELTRMAVGRRLDQRVRVIVDVEDYRKRREARLDEHAREIAERVAETGERKSPEPMNSYERKLVHDAVVGPRRHRDGVSRRRPRSLRRHPSRPDRGRTPRHAPRPHAGSGRILDVDTDGDVSRET